MPTVERRLEQMERTLSCRSLGEVRDVQELSSFELSLNLLEGLPANLADLQNSEWTYLREVATATEWLSEKCLPDPLECYIASLLCDVLEGQPSLSMVEAYRGRFPQRIIDAAQNEYACRKHEIAECG